MSPVCCQQIGSSSFRGATKLTPEIELPCQRKVCLNRTCFEFRSDPRSRESLIKYADSRSDRRELIGSGDAKDRLRLQDSFGGKTNIVVLGQRLPYERLQLRIFKYGPPFFIA